MGDTKLKKKFDTESSKDKLKKKTDFEEYYSKNII